MFESSPSLFAHHAHAGLITHFCREATSVCCTKPVSACGLLSRCHYHGIQQANRMKSKSHDTLLFRSAAWSRSIFLICLCVKAVWVHLADAVSCPLADSVSYFSLFCARVQLLKGFVFACVCFCVVLCRLMPYLMT